VSGEDGSAIDRAGSDAASPRAAYQLVVFSGEEIRTFDLPPAGEVTIGRAEDSTVRIDDPSVSRSHAVLRVGPTLEIEDLGGANGIFVRQRPRAGAGKDTVHLNVRQLVRRKADLVVGDSILFGTTSVVLRHAPKIEIPDLDPPAFPSMGAGAGVVVREPAMRALYQQAARAARSPISILLLGETGVGKEVLARAIHKHSARSKGPFMGINCAAFADSLLESDLFGTEKGAFTGAVQARAGLFEAANGGTVFLDEVGELSLGTQAKLLRVLEERVVTRLGSTNPRPIDVRFVSATNRDIEPDGLDRRFRQDLYFRLAGISLSIPPLRERPREIELLVTSFVSAACRQIDRAVPLAVSPAALERLRAHAWPGNVRELRNVIERATVLCAGDTILPEHLPPSVLKPREAPRPSVTGSEGSPRDPARGGATHGAGDLQGDIKSLERARIADALDRCGGNQSRAAELLGISRGTLISRIAEFALHRPRKRPDDPGA
jgi:two-component system response regulator AtoC